MALEGQADLHDAPTQQDHTDGTDQGENKCRKVVHHSERVIITGCEGCGGKTADAQHYGNIAGKSKPSFFPKRQGISGFIIVFWGCQKSKLIQKHSSNFIYIMV